MLVSLYRSPRTVVLSRSHSRSHSLPLPFRLLPIVTVCGAACIVNDIVSRAQSLACTAPARAIIPDCALVVTLDAQSSPPLPFHYDPLAVSHVEPPSVLATVATARPPIQIHGVNFGVPALGAVPLHSVVVGGTHACTALLWLADDLLACVVQGELAVGAHSVSVSLLNDTSAPVTVTVVAQCPWGMFGQLGELCAACPRGAQCPGLGADPVATAGYYPVSRASFVQCTPTDACLGGE